MWWVSHPGVEDAYEHADHEYREERIEWVGANGAERATQPSEQSHSKGDSLLYMYLTYRYRCYSCTSPIVLTYYCMASAGPRMRRAPLRASTGRQRKSRARVRRVLVQTRSAAAHC